MTKYIKYFVILISLILFGCSDKTDVNQITSSSKNFDLTNGGNGNITGDTVYVQLKPAWEGFNQPQDMIIGREPFIYVADTYNDRIVMMNLNGNILGTRQIRKASSFSTGL